MLNIDRRVFADHLKLTQAYCELQLKNDFKDNAKVFRSINPIFGGKSLFEFKTEQFEFEIVPDVKRCTLTNWTVDPSESESVVDVSFGEQLNYKRQFINSTDSDIICSGRILVSQIDCTVIDGASEVQSLGLVDIYDIPPIDTWFYITKTPQSRLLFAWIPGAFVYYANKAVEVNCVDCLNWADIFFPEEFERYMAIDSDSTETRRPPNIGMANSAADVKPVSLWSRMREFLSA